MFRKLIRQANIRLPFFPNDSEKISFLKGLKNEKTRILKKAEKRIFCFWTGTNPITENRRRCLESMRERSDVPIILVQPNNLNEYILPDHPLPEEFEYLSLVHKSDYLRSYFMFYYGGGYCDIKEILHSWSDAFDLLNSREEKSGIGYPEIVNGVAKIHSDDEFRAMDVYNFNVEMRRNYKKLIGNGAYIFKPKSLIFEFLLKEQERRIRKHQEELKRFPGNVLGNNEGYPLGWSYLLGEIFHPIVLCRYTDVIQRNELRPSFHNYR